MQHLPTDKRRWVALGLVVTASFAVLGYYGREIYRQAPPIPARVVSASGAQLWSGEDLRDGQNVWQSMGGQEVGSIWGHGAYVAPDWSADWLHREALYLERLWAMRDYGKQPAELSAADHASLTARLADELRTNHYDPTTDTLTISDDRAEATRVLGRYYGAIFGSATTFDADVQPIADGGLTPLELRDAYAIATDTIRDAQRQHRMNGFFFWTAWAAAAQRPGSQVSYTNNWPPEPLVGNKPSGALVLWSLASIVLLLAGIGALAWRHATLRQEEEPKVPAIDPLAALKPTPSMRATYKYFAVVALLMLVQVALGAITAHYGVEGQGFYGIPLAEILPYSVTRTWHTQLGIFWIATAWLATGLYLAPAVSGQEPRFQRLGVNLLFVALLVIVVGSMFGTWYGTRQRLGLEMNFWFGHQGYEYVDLGRFWQIFLFVGLFIWLGLVGRALLPAFKKPEEHKGLLTLFVVSAAAIGLFYGAGLMWGQRTHLALAEYWRWWVVHLWVEGFFEVFATVAIAFILSRMGLVRAATAASAVLFATAIFLGGGILGTFHHLYFTGTPTAVLALGAVFSALEVVPLTLMGFEAASNLKLVDKAPWVRRYRWPIYFFVGVAFWNLVGAGLFGFLINPPIALYYLQGLNTTPVHGHAALFGVYGLLGIGLMLFSLKGLGQQKPWREGILRFSFWALNIGLALMVLVSLLPVGIMQALASIEHGMWYARSAEFLQTDLMATLRWLRAIGDTVFAAGVVTLVYAVLGVGTGWMYAEDSQTTTDSQRKHDPALAPIR